MLAQLSVVTTFRPSRVCFRDPHGTAHAPSVYRVRYRNLLPGAAFPDRRRSAQPLESMMLSFGDVSAHYAVLRMDSRDHADIRAIAPTGQFY